VVKLHYVKSLLWNIENQPAVFHVFSEKDTNELGKFGIDLNTIKEQLLLEAELPNLIQIPMEGNTVYLYGRTQ
jgi:hypothetical protein